MGMTNQTASPATQAAPRPPLRIFLTILELAALGVIGGGVIGALGALLGTGVALVFVLGIGLIVLAGLVYALFGVAWFEVARVNGLYALGVPALSPRRRQRPGFGGWLRSLGRQSIDGSMWRALANFVLACIAGALILRLFWTMIWSAIIAFAPLSTDEPVAGPLGIGFSLDPAWKNIVVLGRGVGLATLAPLSQLAAEKGVGVTAVLSARKSELVMSEDLFQGLGATTVSVVDEDGSSDVENVEKILEGLIANSKADAFFTCGSSRLLRLMQKLGKKHDVPGQVAMEQIMVCGIGACYVCMRTFEVNGEQVLRRVCREGPVFDMQEAVGW